MTTTNVRRDNNQIIVEMGEMGPQGSAGPKGDKGLKGDKGDGSIAMTATTNGILPGELLDDQDARIHVANNQTIAYQGLLTGRAFDDGTRDDASLAYWYQGLASVDDQGIGTVSDESYPLNLPASWVGPAPVVLDDNNDLHFNVIGRKPYVINWDTELKTRSSINDIWDPGVIPWQFWIDSREVTDPLVLDGDELTPEYDKTEHGYNPENQGIIATDVNGVRTALYSGNPLSGLDTSPFTNINFVGLREAYQGVPGKSYFTVMKMPAAGDYDPIFNLQDSSKHSFLISTQQGKLLLVGCRAFADPEVVSDGPDMTNFWSTWQIVCVRWDHVAQLAKIRIADVTIATPAFGTPGLTDLDLQTDLGRKALAQDTGVRIGREGGSANYGAFSRVVAASGAFYLTDDQENRLFAAYTPLLQTLQGF